MQKWVDLYGQMKESSFIIYNTETDLFVIIKQLF